MDLCAPIPTKLVKTDQFLELLCIVPPAGKHPRCEKAIVCLTQKPSETRNLEISYFISLICSRISSHSCYEISLFQWAMQGALVDALCAWCGASLVYRRKLQVSSNRVSFIIVNVIIVLLANPDFL